MSFTLDPLLIYLKHDQDDLPDFEAASRAISAAPGIVVCETLRGSDKVGSLYIPDRVSYTYYEDDEPFAGFEPSLGMVLAAGEGCWLTPGQIVIMRDGDGLEFEEFHAGDYHSKQPVRFFGMIVPEGEDEREPGYIEKLPWEESLLGVVEGMDIKCMTGRNILLERDEDDVDRKLDSGLILPDVVSENAQSIATVKMHGDGLRHFFKVDRTGEVRKIQEGDRVVYHPMASLDFYDPENRRLRAVREMAVLAVI